MQDRCILESLPVWSACCLCGVRASSEMTQLSALAPCVWVVTAAKQGHREACSPSHLGTRAFAVLAVLHAPGPRKLVFETDHHFALFCLRLLGVCSLFVCFSVQQRKQCIICCKLTGVSFGSSLSLGPPPLAAWKGQGIVTILHIKKLKHKKATGSDGVATPACILPAMHLWSAHSASACGILAHAKQASDSRTTTGTSTPASALLEYVLLRLWH